MNPLKYTSFFDTAPKTISDKVPEMIKHDKMSLILEAIEMDRKSDKGYGYSNDKSIKVVRVK